MYQTEIEHLNELIGLLRECVARLEDIGSRTAHMPAPCLRLCRRGNAASL